MEAGFARMRSRTTSESEEDEAAAVIKVEREKLAACMTCPICNRLFNQATTISECLHTFCRKCIYDKISGEALYQCPVCNINLGGAPTEKLRADHSLQDLRAKIFSPEYSKTKPERSVPEAEVRARTSSHRRIKERSISPLVLGCKSSKVSANHQGGKRTTRVSIRKKKRVARGIRQHLARDEHQGLRPRRIAVSLDLNMPAVDTESESDGRFCPIWFSLIASNNQGGVPPLPQISSCYLRVKDSSLPVSAIKNYLVQKLGLASDAEVEIRLQGQPVVPTLQLHNLVDWWLQTKPETSNATIGSSAEEFVMVLSYGRKPRLS